MARFASDLDHLFAKKFGPSPGGIITEMMNNLMHLGAERLIMQIANLYQRLDAVAEDYHFYKQVGDWDMAEFSRQRWVYIQSMIEGERRAA